MYGRGNEKKRVELGPSNFVRNLTRVNLTLERYM